MADHLNGLWPYVWARRPDSGEFGVSILHLVEKEGTRIRHHLEVLSQCLLPVTGSYLLKFPEYCPQRGTQYMSLQEGKLTSPWQSCSLCKSLQNLQKRRRPKPSSCLAQKAWRRSFQYVECRICPYRPPEIRTTPSHHGRATAPSPQHPVGKQTELEKVQTRMCKPCSSAGDSTLSGGLALTEKL